MLKNLGEQLVRGKDAALAATAKRAINQRYLKGYGEIVELELDSTNKRLKARIDLRGERETLELQIGRYEIDKSGEGAQVRLYEIRSSREWLTTLAGSHLEGKPFLLPPRLAQALKVML